MWTNIGRIFVKILEKFLNKKLTMPGRWVGQDRGITVVVLLWKYNLKFGIRMSIIVFALLPLFLYALVHLLKS